jgi:hypothetical protein
MALEELARPLSRLLKHSRSARCCDDLAEFERGCLLSCCIEKNSSRGFCFLLSRGTAWGGALEANALPGGARRLAVRAVKGAQFAFIGAERETLDKRAVQAQVLSRKGKRELGAFQILSVRSDGR